MDTYFELTRPDGQSPPIRLAGVERAAPGTGQDAPVAVLCHGFTDRMGTEPLESVAKALLARGFRVVQFDFDGHGASGGSFAGMTVSKEVLDAQAVLARFAGRRTALVGHSQGGVVAALAAARAEKGTVGALALLAPGSVLRDDAQRGRIFDASFDPADPPESVPVMGGRFLLGRGYILDAQSLRIHEEFGNFAAPLCVVHGTGDRIVPWCCGERFVRDRAARCKRDAWKLLPGADHTFTAREPEVSAFVADFLEGVFFPAPSGK